MKVYIYSGEHNAYWRPNFAGYTYNIENAGVYDEEEASYITEDLGPEKKIKLIPIKGKD